MNATLWFPCYLCFGGGGGCALCTCCDAIAADPGDVRAAAPGDLREDLDAQERMLRALIAAHPRNLTWDELAERGEQSPTSSGFEKNVSTLKSYGLIGGGRGTGFVALGHLFLEGAVR